MLPSQDVAESTPTRKTYWPGLDGLRALAVLAVMAYHLGRSEARGGFLGVDVFFVLSGFLISDLLIREEVRTGSIAFRRFYVRRALRLFPALAVVTVLAAVCALVWRSAEWSTPTLSGIPFVALYVGNWDRAFGSDATLGLLAHTWSLAIEEQFYLVWPCVVLLLARRRWPGRSVGRALLGIALVVAAYRFALLAAGASGIRLASGLDTHADGLLIGAALAYWLSDGGVERIRGRHHQALPVVATAGLVVLAGLVVTLPNRDWLAAAGFSGAALATAAVLLGLTTGAVPWLTRVLELGAMTWIGRRSYGLYLWHFPLFLLLADRDYGPVPGAAVAALAAFAVAALSFRFIEAPFLRMKSRFA